MKFYLGVHEPTMARHIPRAFISINRLLRHNNPFAANEWIMDSGAFSLIYKYGRFPSPSFAYAAQIRRFAPCGTLLCAVAQDYMCEASMLKKTGLSIAEHQRLTILRYNELISEDLNGVTIMPVLQGYEASDYVKHLGDYGSLLTTGMWVGVGSVCKRNTNIEAIEHILRAILQIRPDLHLHGFGLKLTALASRAIQDMLYSSDSMAWNFSARMKGFDQQSPIVAMDYYRKVIALLR